jgi:hypothetical protein
MTGESSGRLTPYEMLFGTEELGESEFPAIAEEGNRRDLELSRRDHFAGLDRVRSLLQQLIPEEVEPAALDQYLEITFHCFHFWNAARPIYTLETAVVRSLIDTPPVLAGWQPRSAVPGLYCQLPSNLLWARVTEFGPPEPVEGVFARLALEGGKSVADLLLVLGMRPDRAGLSVASLRADLIEALGQEEPDAFRSDIPGADLAGLYSLQRSSEAVTLLVRTLWYVDAYPESIEPVRGMGEGQAPSTGQIVPTALEHDRVRLVERSRG